MYVKLVPKVETFFIWHGFRLPEKDQSLPTLVISGMLRETYNLFFT